MIYNVFDIVVVPFPFTDSATTKKRPALVISPEIFNTSNEHCILAMITSAKNSSWDYDVKITKLVSTGLTSESVVRFKLFTLDNRFILKKVGELAEFDIKNVKKISKKLFENLI